MKVETLAELNRSAIDRLVPETKTDVQLLNCLLSDALTSLRSDELLAEKAEVSRGDWREDGTCQLELNIAVDGRLSRLSLVVFFAFDCWWDGEKEHRSLKDTTTYHQQYVTLGQLLTEFVLSPDADS